MYIFYSQEAEQTLIDGNGTETGHIIVTTVAGSNGQPKQVMSACEGLVRVFSLLL